MFQLIKSLSKSEKRYFKIFASRHTIGDENLYVKLFDAIDKQSEYDEDAIRKKFKGTKLAKNLSSVKVHLTNLILRSLRQFNGTSKKKYDVRELLDYADILYEKGLYVHAAKVLEKAKKIAKEYDLYISLDEISILERDIAHKTSDYDLLQKFLNETQYETKKYREINEHLAEYEVLTTKLHALIVKHNRTRSTVGKDRYDDIMEHPLLQTPVNEQPFACQIEYHAVWGTYHLVTGNMKDCVFHRKKVVELLESRPHLIMDDPKTYISHMRVLMISLGGNRMFKDFDEAVGRVQKFIASIPEGKKSINLRTEIYTTIYNAKLDIDLDRGLFEEAEDFAKDVEKELEQFSYTIATDGQSVLLYNLFYVYFGLGNFKTALKWMNELMNKKFGEIRVDLQCFSRIMNIVLHYELGNHDLIENLVRSADRFITKKERKFRFETAFLKFANHSLTQPDVGTAAFEEFHLILNTIFEDKFEKKALHYFDFMSWAESKFDSRSFADIMRAKGEEK